MNEQREVTDKGGTMRLGAYPCHIVDGSLARRIYGSAEISERHRHRFEVNPAYHAQLQGDFWISGWSPDGILAEIVELKNHRWFLACQFHPEFKSRPLAPHPLFSSFVKAALALHLERQDDGKPEAATTSATSAA
jgi:CTP synthase